MPRRNSEHEVKVINRVVTDSTSPEKVLEVATTNKGKLREIERILNDYTIIPKKLKIEEIQSDDHHKVIEQKAKDAWEANGYNPILVEDVAMFIKGLNDRPGPHIKDYADDIVMRRLIVHKWLGEGDDRRAKVTTSLGIFDGQEAHIWEGSISGWIANELVGDNGFGFDDMFVPEGQGDGVYKTFAQMSDEEKDNFSMRALALKKYLEEPVHLGYPVFMLEEPYQQELDRIDMKKLDDQKAREFAYKLECLAKGNNENGKLIASKYSPIHMFENSFYRRYLTDPKSKSLGLISTNIDYNKINLFENGDPVLFQIGPERRHLALAQRVEHFIREQDHQKIERIRELEKYPPKRPPRSDMRHKAVEFALDPLNISDGAPIKTISLKELGYKKISAEKEVSRSRNAEHGLFTKIGKYFRAPYTLGSMPPVTGWRDVLVMGAISHMLVFTSRNSIHSLNPDTHADLIKSAVDLIKGLEMGEPNEKYALRNLGAALGSGNVKDEVSHARVLHEKAGVKAFRIYTINSDPRVVETARALRREFGDEVEIFVGQIADRKQAEQLIDDDIKADGLIFGHGGGRQCTSAANGMAITTLEELYSIITRPEFDDTTIITEGGAGTSVGPLFIFGIDAISYNQQMVRGAIECGDLFFQHKNGGICQPYHGSASPPTMLIEYENDKISRVSASGRVEKVEGKPGYMYYSEKVNSMAFHIDRYKHYAARMLADLGVDSLQELHRFLADYDDEILRIVSPEAAVTASAYRI